MVSEVVQKTTKAKLKYGFTGTLPDDKSKLMTLLGLFGNPRTFIRTQELIEKGLGTPLKVNSIVLQYSQQTKGLISKLKQFQSKFKFLREFSPRNEFIANLSTRLKGNSLVLFSMTDHGKELYKKIFMKKYPDFPEKDLKITGKGSFEFQEQYGVYFINGEDNAKTREQTRKVLEVNYKKITLEDFWFRVPEDFELPLVSGELKKAKDLTTEDELSETLKEFLKENNILLFEV